MQPNNFFSLEQVIDHQPLSVTPETPAIKVIRRMQEWGNNCYLTENTDTPNADITGRINNSCALVMEDARLQGIGIDAIALYTQNQAEIYVVLMDLIMPEMSGLTAMRTLKKINPSVKLIANSGLAEKDKITAAERIGIKAFLAKPYTAETLLRQLKDVITAN